MPVGKPRPSHPHALPPTCEPTFVFGFSAESISCLLQRQESPDRVPPKRVVLQATMKLKETKSRHKPPSRKFQTKGIKVVGKWKQVEIDPNVFADGQMDDLVCFEELTDYQLVSPGKNPSSLFSEPSPKKRKAQVVSEKEAEEEGGESSCPKKKMKLKKQKDGLVTEGTTSQKELEMKDAEPEPQGADIACSDPKVEEMVSDNLVQTVLKKKKNKGKRAHSQSTVPKLPKTVKTWMPDVHDQKADVSAWKDLFVPKPVLQALSFLGFSAPTPIQALTLAPAIRDKLDILGAAETGSGKTLAFAIPMIHAVLQWHKGKASPISCNTGVPSGEMKTEARTEAGTLPDETGIQNKDPLSEAGAKARAKSGASVSDQELVFHDGGDGDDAGEGPSFLVKEEPVPEQKENEEKLDEEQTEELNQELDNNSGTYKVRPRRPLLGLVLTPTRELAVQVKQHIDAVAKFTGIKTAILVGGMSTQKQQRMLNRHPEIVVATPGRLWELIKEKHSHVSNLRQLRCLVVDEADRMVEKGHFAELSQLLEMLNDSQYNPKRQTLVFSATLTLVHQAPARILHKKHIKKMDKTAKLDLLMQKIGLRGKPKVIDLTRNEGTVETLTETKIHCEADEKDFYLYYFLMQYPGRSLVFANSISCIKRLSGLLKVLDIMPLTLHACMHQKQRLRNLEQFARLEDCVLLATDVAARGLDIPEVQHVIHYQVPRTSEIYIHRSGRTARATREGLSLMLIGPEDVINFKKIYKTLKKDEDIPLFPVQTKYMDIVKERIRLARQIEKAEYRNFQACLHNSWLEQAAAALEIELEEDMYKGGKADLQEERRRQKQMKVLKKELRHLLAQPLFKEELRTKYPTQSGRLPQLVAAPRKGESALSCLSKQKKKQLKGRQQEPQPSTSAS